MMAPARPALLFGMVCLSVVTVICSAGSSADRVRVKSRANFNITLPCPAASGSGSQHELSACASAEATWSKVKSDQVVAAIQGPWGKRIAADGRSLSFYYLSAQDEGHYECQITCGGKTYSGTVELLLINQMEFTSPVLTINGVDGSSSTLHCFSSSPTVQPRRVTWYKNYPDEKLASWDGAGGVVYPPHRGKLWHLLLGVEGMNWSLKLNSTRHEDAGLYACDAQLEDGREEVMVVRLSVMHACRIVLTNEEIPKTLGDSVLFSAHITTPPKCTLKTIMWTKASYIDRAKWTSYKLQIASLNSSTHVHSRYRGRVCLYGDNSSNSSLSIQALTADDAGYYKVTAVWDSGDGELRSESQQFLAVHEGCEVYTPRDPLRCAPGETVTLPCQAYSTLCPLDTVTWLKVTSGNQSIVRRMKTGNNNTESGFKGRVRLAALGAHDASLILTDVRLNDSGIYTCQHRWGPENEIRSSDASVTLVVQRELLPRPRDATTESAAASATPRRGGGSLARAHHLTLHIISAVLVFAGMALIVLLYFARKKLGCASNCLAKHTRSKANIDDAAEVVYTTVTVAGKQTAGSSNREDHHHRRIIIDDNDNSERVIYSTVTCHS
ncbi:unnamed protein product [Lampetra fluviatilis]